MKEDVIKIADGLYADRDVVIKSIIEDILSRFKEPSITLRDIRGYNDCTIAISDGKIIKDTWEEDHTGHYCNEKRIVVSEHPDDVMRIETVWHLISLYQP